MAMAKTNDKPTVLRAPTVRMVSAIEPDPRFGWSGLVHRTCSPVTPHHFRRKAEATSKGGSHELEAEATESYLTCRETSPSVPIRRCTAHQR